MTDKILIYVCVYVLEVKVTVNLTYLRIITTFHVRKKIKHKSENAVS
jgi:hypothetical protein